MDKLTLSRYLKKVDAEQSTKDNYRKRYEEVQDKIRTRWFYIQSIDHIVIHFKIPSEKVEVSYDVLIEFPFGKATATFKNFRNSSIKVYSNCPSFVYMNARLFDQKNFLIPWTKSLYDKATFETKEDASKETKTYDVRYEKSLYFAAMHLDRLDTIQILTLMREAVKIPRPDALLTYLRSPDKAMFDRTVKTVNEKRKKQAQQNVIDVINKVSPAKIPDVVKKTSRVKKISSSKKIKHI